MTASRPEWLAIRMRQLPCRGVVPVKYGCTPPRAADPGCEARVTAPESRRPLMPGRWLNTTVIMSISAIARAPLASPAKAVPAAGHQACSPGARSLSPLGAHLYPDTGNGGYTSVHTDVDLVYNAAANMFLPGNHVVLTDRATQCLTSFSLDFERTSANAKAGPDMSVQSVTVNGQPAAFTFAQPAYPGDPHSPNDPNPLAHEASQDNPVGGPQHNPLPPACSPRLLAPSPAQENSLNGPPCPASKLVIAPAAPVGDGAAFTVR